MTDRLDLRALSRIPGYWAASTHRGQPHAQALSHAHLRTQHCRRQVPLLVLPSETAEGEEGQWRDHQLERSRTTPLSFSKLGTTLPSRGTDNAQLTEKRPTTVKNFGIWIRYDSRSGTHNMYKEYREMSRCDAVHALYQDMASRHRARFRTIHVRLASRIIRDATNSASDPESGGAREDG